MYIHIVHVKNIDMTKSRRLPLSECVRKMDKFIKFWMESPNRRELLDDI